MFSIAVIAATAVAAPATASADSKLDMLGDALSGLAEGVFTKSNLQLEDIVGEWTSTGSAVCFQGDDFLKKAGGAAASKVVEEKIDPYYKKLGLDNAVLMVNEDGTFKIVAKKLSLSGVATANGDGTFNFNFKALGKINLGSIKAYVQKSGSNIDVTFDVKKLKNLVSAIAKTTNISLAKTAASVLDSYDGLCVGFKMKRTGGDASRDSIFSGILGGNKKQEEGNPDSTTQKSATDSARDFLRDIMNKNKKK